MRDSLVFQKRPKPPAHSRAALLRMCKGLSQSTVRKVQAEEPNDLTCAAWKGTQDEVCKSWIVEDNEPDLGNLCIARRFGVQQKSKIRVIDDFKQSGLNGSCGLPEKYSLFSIAASLVLTLNSAGAHAGISLKGAAFDLVSAYKQFAVHPEDRRLTRVCALDTDEMKACVYSMRALPFGATGSVAGFLRVSSAIAYIGQVDLRLWWFLFFDDFPIVSERTSGKTLCESDILSRGKKS